MQFCNINFNVKNKQDMFQPNNTKIIIAANAAVIVEANNSKRFFEILKNNYVTFDGQIPLIIAKWLSFLKLTLLQAK